MRSYGLQLALLDFLSGSTCESCSPSWGASVHPVLPWPCPAVPGQPDHTGTYG